MPLRVVTQTGAWPVTPHAPERGMASAAAVWGPAWIVGPAAPATALDRSRIPVLEATAPIGGEVVIPLVIENHQRVATLLRLMSSALTSASGSVWSPLVTISPHRLVIWPGDRMEARLRFEVPVSLEPDRYLGAVVLVGVGGGRLELALTAVSA